MGEFMFALQNGAIDDLKNICRGRLTCLPSRKEAIDDLKNICPPENGARNQGGNGGKKGKQGNRKTGRHEGLPVRIWANSYIRPPKCGN